MATSPSAIAVRPSRRPAHTRLSPAVVLAALLAGVAAGGLPALYGAALLVGAIGVVATLASPVVGLAGLGLVIPLSPANESVGNLPITPTDGLVMIVLASTAAARCVRRRADLRLTGAFWPGVCFLCVGILSAATAPDLGTSAKELVRQIELVGVLVVAATFCQRRMERQVVVSAFLVGLIAEAALGWAQFLLRQGPDAFRIGAFLRAYGTFGQPNPFGGYLVMTLPVALAVALWLRPVNRRAASPVFALALAASAVGGVALLMSLSRGALLGLVGAVVVLVAGYTRRGGTIFALLVTATLTVVFLNATQLIPSAISGRLAQVMDYVGWFDAAQVVPTPQNWAVVERMAHWNAALSMYMANPILGVGPGHYPTAYPLYRVNDFWLDPLGHAHNFYLNVMAELGFLGITTYVSEILAWVCVIVAAYRRSRAAVDRALTVGVLASLVGVAIHNVFDNLSVHGLGTEMGLLVGLCAAIGFSQAERELEPN